MLTPYALIDTPSAPATRDSTIALAAAAWSFHLGMAQYAPTALVQLPRLAEALGIGTLALKDESTRFGLNAFKGLGPSFAMHHWLATHDVGSDAVFATATDGNHGRAVAWMARQLGTRAVIYMPGHSVPARIEAIEREGARVVLVAEGYDAAVARVMHDAATHHWIVIQDTVTETYRTVPEWIAAGYWTMARELETSLHPPARAGVDLVVLHAGVGTWPAAMVEYYWHRYGAERPKLLVVEPIEAACVLESVQQGHPVTASGSQRTIMAGLNCGFPSLAAFDILHRSVDAFVAIPDHFAASAMRQLASPLGDDREVVAGESGAAGLAGLTAVLGDASYEPVRRHLELGPRTRVLVWSTEGATDPDNWARVVGREVPA